MAKKYYVRSNWGGDDRDESGPFPLAEALRVFREKIDCPPDVPLTDLFHMAVNGDVHSISEASIF